MRILTFLAILIAMSGFTVAQQRDPATAGQEMGTLEQAVSRAERAMARALAIATTEKHQRSKDISKLLESIRALRLGLGVDRDPMKPQILHRIKIVELDADDATEFFSDLEPAPGETESGDALAFVSDLDIERLNRLEADVLSAPNILTLDGQRANVTIGGEKMVPYLVRQGETDNYVLEQEKVTDGMFLETVVNLSKDRRFVNCKIRVQISRIIGKTPLEPGAKTVGKAIVDARDLNAIFTSPVGKTVAIMLPSSEDQKLIVLVTLEAIANHDESEEKPRRKRDR